MFENWAVVAVEWPNGRHEILEVVRLPKGCEILSWEDCGQGEECRNLAYSTARGAIAKRKSERQTEQRSLLGKGALHLHYRFEP
jgi:hypothetical protein